MDSVDKSRIRLEHWIKHNDQHESEYARFADELEEAGFKSAAEEVKRMIHFTTEGNECLRRALVALPVEE